MLKDYKGWLIHDFYPFYFRFTEARHAVCNAHVLRGLQLAFAWHEVVPFTNNEAGRDWRRLKFA